MKKKLPHSSRKKRESKKHKGKLLRTLIDTGSTRNTIKANILRKTKLKKRKHPLLWDTFTGTLKTYDYAKGVEIHMPEFSDSKSANLDFDVIPEEASKSIPYDMVIGRSGLKDLKIVIDYDKNVIRWGEVEVVMKSDDYYDSKEKLYAAFVESAEPTEVK